MEKIKEFIGIGRIKVDELLETIETTLQSVYKKMKQLDVAKINELLPLTKQINQQLNELKEDYNRKMDKGTLLIENLNRKTIRLAERIKKIESNIDKFEIARFYEDFLSYTDHLSLFKLEVGQLSYERGALTVMGYILALMPVPIGLFGVIIGLVLFLDKDIRAKLNAILIILVAGIVFGYHFILF